MFSENKNPFLIKLVSSIEAYTYTFLAPLLIFLLTKNIHYSGGFFLLESIIKFMSYSFAGSIVNHFNIKAVLKNSLTLRFICTMNALLIYSFVPKYQPLFLMINGWCYYSFNSLFATAFETIFQKQDTFTHKTQVWLSSGELISGAIATAVLTLFAFFKIKFIYLFPGILILFLTSYWMLSTKLNHIKEFHIKNNHHIIINFLRDVRKTIKILLKNKQLFILTLAGFIPLAILIVIEQKNMFKFTSLFNSNRMQEIHFLFKFILFVVAGLAIPFLSFKVTNQATYLKMSILFIILGFLFSIHKTSILLNFLGFVFLGLAHYTMIVYRKIKRLDIMIKNDIFFNSLGVFFAIEGLGGIVSYSFLAFFGSSFQALIFFGIVLISMLLYFRKEIQQ
jgi:hypothetical protein